MNYFTREKICLIFIVLLGLWLRLWGADWGLPYQYQTEEYKVIKYALKMGGGGEGGGIDLNPHFFEYPSLYLYFILSIYGGYYLLGRILGTFSGVQDFARLFIQDPTSFYLLGRVLESLFGIGVVILTYFIGKKLLSRKVGLCAAFLTTILPIFVYKGHITKGDMAAIFLGLIFWFYSYRIYETGEKKYYYLSGALLGLAISTKYYMAMMGIVLPLAHFLNPNRGQNRYLLVSLFLVPVLFVMGTPYSILSSEFIHQFREVFLVFRSSDPTSLTSFDIQKYLHRVYIVSLNLMRMYDGKIDYPLGSYGLGILNFFGFIWLNQQKRNQSILLIAPVFAYWVVVGIFSYPAAGYLAPIFPLCILYGSYLIDQSFSSILQGPGLYKKGLKIVILVFFFITIFNVFRWSLLNISYSYTLKDTRTIAKEWIESNLKSQSKVLTDLLPFSPPLEMTHEQIEKFYKRSIELKHYKRDYFRLKLETFRKNVPTYEIFIIKRSAFQLGVSNSHLKQTQQTQDLVTVSGNDSDFENVQKIGIEYFIVNGWAERDVRENCPLINRFYKNLKAKSRLVKEFVPQSKYHPGPEIEIYQIGKE